MHTDTEGVHNATASQSGRYVIDSYSTPTIPRKIDIIDTQTGKNINLLTAANPFDGYKMPVIETGTIKAADGVTDLYYRLIKPADMDPNKNTPPLYMSTEVPMLKWSQEAGKTVPADGIFTWPIRIRHVLSG